MTKRISLIMDNADDCGKEIDLRLASDITQVMMEDVDAERLYRKLRVLTKDEIPNSCAWSY